MDTVTSLPVSKQIKIIEAMSFMLASFGKLREQGVQTTDLPDEMKQVQDTLNAMYAHMTDALPTNGKEYLAREAIKIVAPDDAAARLIESKLFELGFGYLLKGTIRQEPTTLARLQGFRVTKRGHMTAFVRDDDDTQFNSDLARAVDYIKVMKAKKSSDL